MAGNSKLDARRAIVVATDLILQSRLVEGLRALGYEVVTADSPAAVHEALRPEPAALLLLDLQAELPWRDALAAARELDRGLPVLAYGQHTKPAVLRAARDAGCDLAVPRSRLAEDLPQLIERVLAAR